MLTKSAFLEFLSCPQEFWLKHHHPDLLVGEVSLLGQHNREQGYAVERFARELDVFKDANTQFQRVFEIDELYSRSDIVTADPSTGHLSIYEVKAGASVKAKYLHDLAFQKIVAERAGNVVDKLYAITVDTSYVRNGDIEADRLLVIHDVTDDVYAMLGEMEEFVSAAILQLETEPVPDIRNFCGAKLDCKFLRRNFKDIPEYNIGHIPRITDKKVIELLDLGVIDIRHVPAGYTLTEIQRRQVELAIAGEARFDVEAIRAIIGEFEYPIHFLDYETTAHLAIPPFEGVRPYQSVPFQFSLHTLAAPGAEITDKHYIATKLGVNPSRDFLAGLSEALSGKIGKVLVWNKTFEKGRNNELAKLFPEHAVFLEQLNESIYDLKDVITKGHYQHPNFRGSASLKDVLPVVAPELSYDALGIGDGTAASILWYRMATGRMNDVDAARTYDELKDYCTLDTLAMVKIFDFLKEL